MAEKQDLIHKVGVLTRYFCEKEDINNERWQALMFLSDCALYLHDPAAVSGLEYYKNCNWFSPGIPAVKQEHILHDMKENNYINVQFWVGLCLHATIKKNKDLTVGKTKQYLKELGIPPAYAYRMRNFFNGVSTDKLRGISRILRPYENTKPYGIVNIADISKDQEFRRICDCNLL